MEPKEKDPSRSNVVDSVFEHTNKSPDQVEHDLATGEGPRLDAESLWARGKHALERNDVDGAVQLLTDASTVAEFDLVMQASIRGTLAHALAKRGRFDEADAMLGEAAPHLDGGDAGRLRNQRGLLLMEMGDLTNAYCELEEAHVLLHAAGDRSADARTTLNLGAVASQIARLGDAGRWLRMSYLLAHSTGQPAVAAASVSNLGYVASRRGDFAEAFRAFRQARVEYGELVGFDLSVALLDLDEAEVRLDAGLFRAAQERAAAVLGSVLASENTTLVARAQLVLGEALLRQGMWVEAGTELRRATAMFAELDQPVLQLRADALLATCWSRGAEAEIDVEATCAMLARLTVAGWHREAASLVISTASAALLAGQADAAVALLDEASESVAYERPSAGAAVSALRALTDAWRGGSVQRATSLLREAVRAREEEIEVLGSLDLGARQGEWLRMLGELGVHLAMSWDDPHQVLYWADREKSHKTSGPGGRASPELIELRSELRDVQVTLREAQQAGSPVVNTQQRRAALEREIVAHERELRGPGHCDRNDLSIADLQAQLGRRWLVEYFVHGADVRAAVVRGDDVEVLNLGPVAAVVGEIDHQIGALTRMGSARQSRRMALAACNLAADAGRFVDERLVKPLALPADVELVIVPTSALHHVAWAGLPSLCGRSLTIALSAATWATAADLPSRLSTLSTFGFASGPGLVNADVEVRALAGLRPSGTTSATTGATTTAVCTLLESCDVVHIAAHGHFRGDSPLFSSLTLEDGELNLLDIAGLRRVPELVILSACATATAGVFSGDGLLGTTATLLRVGVRSVVATLAPIGDAAALRFMTDLHRALATGIAPPGAVRVARAEAIARNTPADTAAAAVVQFFGAAEPC